MICVIAGRLSRNPPGDLSFGGTIIASPGKSAMFPKLLDQWLLLVCLLITVPSARIRKMRFTSAVRVGPPVSFRYALRRFLVW